MSNVAYLSPARSVTEFHEACDLPVRTIPANPDYREEALRWRLLHEEVNEYRDAMLAENLVEVADALADIVYICYGTALTYGIDLDRVLAEVHRSNMTKCVDGKVVRRDDGKILKPEGYQRPEIAKVLATQGLPEQRGASESLSTHEDIDPAVSALPALVQRLAEDLQRKAAERGVRLGPATVSRYHLPDRNTDRVEVEAAVL